MPLIQIKVLEGSLSQEKKTEMIARVSDVVAEIEARPNPKENLLPFTACIIEEVPSFQWGVGGDPVTLEKLNAILEG